MTNTHVANRHASRCLLNAYCSLANSEPACNAHCPHYIALHSTQGNGGRSASANLPRDYRLTTLANSPARADQAETYRKIEAYVKTFARQFEGERIKSLYLWSESPGTGKTTTASAVLNEWLITHYIGSLQRNRQADLKPAYFLDVNEWQTLYNAFNRSGIPQEMKEPKAKQYYSRMDIAMEAPFAVLDDIGVRDATPGFRGDLHSIINYRVTEQKPTVFTSNLPIAELEAVFSEKRLVDRLRDQTFELAFKGESKRGLRK
jgi:DNA replication protein DnaC